ncbi:MAG: hypothetical protein WBB28_15820 [Crinalium sp.]
MDAEDRAEVSRINGSKSKGAITERGKAIASTNATKHGLLSTKPPLLVSEDVELFKSFLEGLQEDYDPQTTIEHLLIQQCAMAWLRLWRLWAAEAASTNYKILDRQNEIENPSPSFDLSFLNEYLPKGEPNKALQAQIEAAKIAELSIPDEGTIVKFSRYERHILKCLNDSLDRLNAIQQRRNEALAGSFGEN